MNGVTNALRRVRSGIELLTGCYRSWEELEYFDESWKNRIEEMARFIAPGESVIDLGCGKMWLKPLLKNNIYHPVDYKRRDESTVVANFNRHEYPDIVADVAFLSGTLEYIEDSDWFVRQICSRSKKCVVSYCTTECYPDLKVRNRKAWKSHLSRCGLLELFAKNGMDLDSESGVVAQNPIFVFSKRKGEVPAV
ncbi:MAG: hypothetical protein LAO09_17610 [Acidobacteriia bacterium]|nr:hypothetical protein [Terriglobia bacterium]